MFIINIFSGCSKCSGCIVWDKRCFPNSSCHDGNQLTNHKQAAYSTKWMYWVSSSSFNNNPNSKKIFFTLIVCYCKPKVYKKKTFWKSKSGGREPMDNCLENALAPPTYLTSELSRCCISTTSEKHTKQPAK